MKTAASYRQEARQILGNNIFSNQWIYALLVELIILAITSALSATFVGGVILGGILSCAVAFYYQGRARGAVPHDGLSALFDGAKQDVAGAIITGLLHTIFLTLWSLLFIIPGIIKSFSYAMTFYIKNDHPEYSAIDAITESRRMMDGHKMRYFILQLSFIGWWIVGALCLGIGTLWVKAYVASANAAFYEDLKAGYNTASAYNSANTANTNSGTII